MLDIPLLDHELAEDELAWTSAVYRAFAEARAAGGDPKAALRDVLSRPEFRLPTPIDMTGDGHWRGGRNRHGRFVAGVFLKQVELHRHEKTRTDQFPMYVVGEADGFSLGDDGTPIVTPVNGGDHCHNPPDAPHAFLPRVGKPVPDNWEIAFIAITPRNLREDTLPVRPDTRMLYETATGRSAPDGV